MKTILRKICVIALLGMVAGCDKTHEIKLKGYFSVDCQGMQKIIVNDPTITISNKITIFGSDSMSTAVIVCNNNCIINSLPH